MNITIYHNPRCSQSRATLEALRARGIEPTIIEYLRAPPSHTELTALLAALGMTARALARRQEAAWQAAGLDTASEQEIIETMVREPVLIERPIVVRGQRAVLGRPPANIEQLFNDADA